VAQERAAWIAGLIPDDISLPVGIVGTQRTVFLSYERLRHLALRRPDWLLFCLTHMGAVLDDPQYLGYRPAKDPRRVEFVRRVGIKRQPLLVAVKFLDDKSESWLSTAVKVSAAYLTRRMRAGTMHQVSRGP
jgi:hypothetical protein